jgi:hypothetical protein
MLRRLIAVALAALVLSLIALLAFTVAVRAGIIGQAHGPIAGDLGGARSDRPGLRVLFVGNSITYVNDMPHLLTRLVESDPANRPIFAVRFTPPGVSFSDDVADPRLATLLPSVRWNQVVLQEQSDMQALPTAERAQLSDAPAGTLAVRILEDGAQPLLFETGGFPQGDAGGDSFVAMEARLEQGYGSLGFQLHAPVAPVGRAYAVALTAHPGTPLWGPDDYHPSLEGAYLAACVFYDVLYHRTPTSSYTAGLDPAEAAFLQRSAAVAVKQAGTGVPVR